MNDYISKINLDLNCKETPVVLSAGQFDVGRKIEVSVTADGVSYDVTGCTAVCKGANFAIECEIDSENNKVIITTDKNMLSNKGNVAARLIITDGTRAYSTQSFIVVVKSAFEGNIAQSNKYPVLIDLINRVIQITETGGILIDKELNANSNNPISNALITEALQTKINDKTGSVHYGNLNADIFTSQIAGGNTRLVRSTDLYTALCNFYTKADIDELLASIDGSGSGIILGYTKGEIDEKLANKINTADIIEQFDSLTTDTDKLPTIAALKTYLENYYYSINEIYNSEEIDEMLENISTKAGSDGKSAYQIAVDNGYTGTQTQWLASLKGADGANGEKGDTGADGAKGEKGDKGDAFTYSDFTAEQLAQLKGSDGLNGTDGTNGIDGKSAYQLAVEDGFNGTEAQWLASLHTAQPVFVSSVDEMTDQSKVYVLNGEIYAYTHFVTQGYTNLIPLSVSTTDDSVFNTTGYQDGTYVSGTSTGNDAACTTTGLIQYDVNKDIYIKGIAAIMGNAHTRIALWNSGKSIISGAQKTGSATNNPITDWFTITQIADNYFKLTPTSTLKAIGSVKYMRWSFVGSGANIILTVDEAIEGDGGTTEGYKFANTGVTFAPVDYENRIIALETELDNVTAKLDNIENDGTILPPNYWISAIDSKTSVINTLAENAGNELVQFVWFSDAHIYAGNQKVKNIGSATNYAASKFDIPLIVSTGDSMAQDSPSTEAGVMNLYNAVKEFYAPIDKSKFLNIMGNHDGMWGTKTVNGNTVSYVKQLSKNKMYNILFKEQALDFRRHFSDYGLYYYVDNAPQKTRFIMLDNHFGADDSVDSEGYAVYNRFKNFVYGQEQLEWLCNEALHLPNGYSAIVFTHSPIDTNPDEAMLRGIIDAFNNKTSYSGTAYVGGEYWGNNDENDEYLTESISVDFTNTTGEIIALFTGHMHKDIVNTTLLTCPMITITTAGGDVRDSNAPVRTVSTATETAFDIVSIDKANRVIHCTRFGVGSDREIEF